MDAVLQAQAGPAPVRNAPVIEIAGLYKTFLTVRNERIDALVDISLTVADREFVTIVGPSGYGKSTLLKVLAGLIPSSRGSVRVIGH